MRARTPWVVVAVAAVVVGCGSQQAQPLTPETTLGVQQQEGAGDVDPAAAVEPLDWPNMSYERRVEYMKTTVMPAMRDIFKSYDQRYGEMTCATCHGEKGKEEHFKMPSASLTPLDPTDHFAAAAAKSPEMLEFMRQEVMPNIVALLQLQPYDPGTGQGFGCFGCHTRAGK